jgi:chromosome partitioning protein
MKNNRLLSLVNQKGGVGKSTTAINLGAYLATFGKKVLLVDLDPQANASSGLGILKTSTDKCIYHALVNKVSPEKLIEKTKVEGLSILPSSIELAGAEIELVSAISRETRLRSLLKPLQPQFDYILVDCPPSLGLLTINALTASDEVIIPIQCEYYALEGLSRLLESIKLIKIHLNPDLEVDGVLMTMYDGRTRLSQQVVEEVRRFFPDKTYNTIIPRTVRLSEAPSFGQPIALYNSTCKGAIAYKKLAKEVMEHG